MYSIKDETNTTLHLIRSKVSEIPIVPTKYPQGRGNDVLYGPPFSVSIGFPSSSIKMNTKGNIAYLKNMIVIFICLIFWDIGISSANA